MQDCPLSQNLFEVYIDELHSFMSQHIQEGDGCLLQRILTDILLFVDDAIILSSSPKELHIQIDALYNYCDLRQMIVLSKPSMCLRALYLPFFSKGVRLR
jgi:hypothetical protein